MAWHPSVVSPAVPEVEWTPRDRVIGTVHLPDGVSYELIDEGRPFGFARALEGDHGELFDEDVTE